MGDILYRIIDHDSELVSEQPVSATYDEITDGLFQVLFDRSADPVGKALGLGLYSALAIIERHNGQISAFSQPGTATTFEVILPLDNPRDL